MMEMLLETWQYFMPVLLAAFVGGLIGIEREYRDKTAGFRTMILIAIGACLFTLFSSILGTAGSDLTRIAAAIVTGVGFLGAGVIIKDGPTIRGLTTAASIWLVASLGMGAGAGEYALVVAVTALVLLVLVVLPPFEHWLDRLHDFSEFHVTIKNTDKAEDAVFDIFDAYGVPVVEIRRTREVKGERVLHLKANMNVAQHEDISADLVAESSVIAITDR